MGTSTPPVLLLLALRPRLYRQAGSVHQRGLRSPCSVRKDAITSTSTSTAWARLALPQAPRAAPTPPGRVLPRVPSPPPAGHCARHVAHVTSRDVTSRQAGSRVRWCGSQVAGRGGCCARAARLSAWLVYVKHRAQQPHWTWNCNRRSFASFNSVFTSK